MNPIITTNNLNKHYGSFQALKDINLKIQPGTIVGLIGPNGAGKTTLLKTLFGLTSFSGEVNVAGFNPRTHRVSLLERMCFIADVATLPRWLKVQNAINFLEGVHPRFDSQKALELLSKTSIPLEKKVKQLSKGMIVQLHLALVMAIDAEILILDEPTLGLDILYRKRFYQQLLNNYFNENRTIVITTHQVEEVESLLTDLLIINEGQISLDCGMEKITKEFIQVTTHGENLQQALALNPLYQVKELGKTRLIFRNQDRATLAELGELSTPSVSDIFVAEITGENSL